MKSVMLTIRLKWFYLTYKGIKTVEVRKSCPKNFNGDVFEVVSKTNFEKDLMEIPENEREFFRQFKGKVGLKFTLNKVEEIKFFEEFVYPNGYEDYDGEWVDTSETYKNVHYINSETRQKSCLSYGELQIYLGKKTGYAWHISNLEIFDKPKELSEFKRYGEIEYAMKNADNPLVDDNWHEIVYLTKAPQSWCYVESEE